MNSSKFAIKDTVSFLKRLARRAALCMPAVLAKALTDSNVCLETRGGPNSFAREERDRQDRQICLAKVGLAAMALAGGAGISGRPTGTMGNEIYGCAPEHCKPGLSLLPPPRPSIDEDKSFLNFALARKASNSGIGVGTHP